MDRNIRHREKMKVKEVLSSPDKWTQDEIARGRHGYRISPISLKACQWSLLGAVMVCNPDTDKFIDVMDKVMRELKLHSLDDFLEWEKDNALTFDEVRDLVEKLDI